jgi:hypothetical protein
MKYRLKKELPGLREGTTIDPENGLGVFSICPKDFPDFFEPIPEGKLVREWLQELPDGYRERAWNNLYNPAHNNGKDEDSRVDDMACAIHLAFPWRSSPEGFHFWDKVESHYRNATPLPPLPDSQPTTKKKEDLSSTPTIVPPLTSEHIAHLAKGGTLTHQWVMTDPTLPATTFDPNSPAFISAVQQVIKDYLTKP